MHSVVHYADVLFPERTDEAQLLPLEYPPRLVPLVQSLELLTLERHTRHYCRTRAAARSIGSTNIDVAHFDNFGASADPPFDTPTAPGIFERKLARRGKDRFPSPQESW